MKPQISIIIPTYNEEKNIGRLLQSIEKQSFKAYEIIVVDSDSTDRTVEIAKEHNARVINEKRRGVSIAKNRGAREAKGGILYFIDADTELFNKTLESINAAFDEDTACASGPIYPLEKTGLPIKAWYFFNFVILVKASKHIGKPSFVTPNLSIRADIFRKVNGFDESMKTYEDCDLSIKASNYGKMVYSKGIKIKSSARRIMAWGLGRYIRFTASNSYRYYIKGKPRSDYEPVRE